MPVDDNDDILVDGTAGGVILLASNPNRTSALIVNVGESDMRVTTDGSVPTSTHGKLLTPGAALNMIQPTCSLDDIKAIRESGINTFANASEEEGVVENIIRYREVSPLIISAQTDNYVLTINDDGKVVEMDAATGKNVTVPPNSDVAFPIGTVIELYQAGVGLLTVVAGAGVTVRNVGALSGQYATASLRKRATNEWVLTGELA